MDLIDQLIEYQIQDVVTMFVEDTQMECNEAMDEFFRSAIFEKLLDPETGLYETSPAYVYTLYQNERKFGKIVQLEE